MIATSSRLFERVDGASGVREMSRLSHRSVILPAAEPHFLSGRLRRVSSFPSR